ncbi:MAG: HD-GYP domain-containing protein, partial [Treponema sp.]|nr:HD-GYP domain-containing protein [Treponema sp.]
MRKIPVNALREGQIFTEPVYIQDNNLFVPAGIPVKKKDIDRLIKWGIDNVLTDGTVVSDTADSGKAAAESKSSPSMGDIKQDAPVSLLSLPSVMDNAPSYRTYTDLIAKLGSLFQNIAEGLSVESRSIDGIAGRLLQAVREHRDQIVGYILGGEVTSNLLAKSSVNTAILSTLIAMELRIPNHKILQITTGALLHDIGMLKLPKDIVEKKGGLSETELSRIQAHPLYAY